MPIETYPDLPVFDTPSFWAWLDAWHYLNNQTDPYRQSIVLLDEPLRTLAPDIDRALEELLP